MKLWIQQGGTMAGLTLRLLHRSGGFWWAIAAAILATTGGWWWRDFGFGDDSGRFLRHFSWSMQSLGVVVLAVAAVLQITTRTWADGTLPVALGRGVSAGAIIVGQVIAVGGLLVVFEIGAILATAGLVAAVGSPVNAGGLMLGGLMQVAKGTTVGTAALWFASFGRGVIFVMMATGGLVVTGHLQPWAREVGGWVSGVSRLVPDLNWLSRSAWMVDATGGLEALLHAGIFSLALGALASRCLSRREF